MRCVGIVLLSLIFFTACSPDQAAKNYYKASLNGNYAHAGHYVVESQKEAYILLEQQQTDADRKALRRRSIRVRDVRSERTNDSAAVATCMLLIKEHKPCSAAEKGRPLLESEQRPASCEVSLRF